MPGESGVTVVTMLVCFFYFAREAAGALGTRHSLRPPVFEGGSFINSGGLRRGNAVSRQVLRRGPSFETRPMAAPQDEVVVRGTRLDPHGEEAHSAVSNHEARTE